MGHLKIWTTHRLMTAMTSRKLSIDRKTQLTDSGGSDRLTPPSGVPSDIGADQSSCKKITPEHQTRLDSAVMILVNYLVSISSEN